MPLPPKKPAVSKPMPPVTKKPKKGLMSKMDRIARLLRQNPNSQAMSDIASMGKMRYPGE